MAIILGVTGGVRQNDLIFLLPVWFYSLSSLGRKEKIASVILLSLVVATWALPMINLSGGILGYFAALGAERKVSLANLSYSQYVKLF